MGAVTGKGLSDLIREEFGFRVTFFLMIALVVTNFGNVMAEFAGVASSLELFGISRYIVVPLAAALVWVLVVHGTYSSVEKIFLVGVGVLRLLHRRRRAGASRLEGRRVRDRHAAARTSASGNYGYLYMADRPGRHDDRAVDAVLPAGVDRREGRDGAAVQGVALGRDRRLPVRRGRRLVHHRRLRGDAAHGRHARESATRPTRRRRCGRWPASTRTCCLPPGCSTRRCSRRRSCRSRRRTRSAKGWGSSRGSTRSSTKRRRSTGCIRC